MDAASVTVKTRLDLNRIAIGFPKSTAGKILPMVFDKSNDILERVAQKYADLMGKLRLCLQTVSKMCQQTIQVRFRVTSLR